MLLAQTVGGAIGCGSHGSSAVEGSVSDAVVGIRLAISGSAPGSATGSATGSAPGSAISGSATGSATGSAPGSTSEPRFIDLWDPAGGDLAGGDPAGGDLAGGDLAGGDPEGGSSAEEDCLLLRAARLSLGSLGVATAVTLQVGCGCGGLCIGCGGSCTGCGGSWMQFGGQWGWGVVGGGWAVWWAVRMGCGWVGHVCVHGVGL